MVVKILIFYAQLLVHRNLQALQRYSLIDTVFPNHFQFLFSLLICYKGYEYATTRNYATVKKIGMIGRIIMFLVPGIAFFIFLPACLFSYFEDWPYVRSVYYAFVTLTTIGFGDYVPTFQDGQVTHKY